jgi:hypothetical protein
MMESDERPGYRWNCNSINGFQTVSYDIFEVFTAVTMKNVVFRDIKPQFVPHRRHITSPLQSPAG